MYFGVFHKIQRIGLYIIFRIKSQKCQNTHCLCLSLTYNILQMKFNNNFSIEELRDLVIGSTKEDSITEVLCLSLTHGL